MSRSTMNLLSLVLALVFRDVQFVSTATTISSSACGFLILVIVWVVIFINNLVDDFTGS